jgi:hypothetical protein
LSPARAGKIARTHLPQTVTYSHPCFLKRGDPQQEKKEVQSDMRIVAVGATLVQLGQHFFSPLFVHFHIYASEYNAVREIFAADSTLSVMLSIIRLGKSATFHLPTRISKHNLNCIMKLAVRRQEPIVSQITTQQKNRKKTVD